MEYRRVIIPGAIYFFTLNLKNRESDLLIKEIDTLRIAFKRTKSKYPFKIEGIVILPEHLHMMLRLPSGDGDYSLRIRLIKSIFTHNLQANESISQSRKKKSERGIWQRRFWEHFIRNEKDYEHHLNYIHFNPVKHGYVTRASDWPYSSIHRDIKLGLLSTNWASKHDVNDNQFGE
ncbi:transposase [uncultured Legionella sp.]|uniref:REP-associated tyrosine transposase n=1 Tax=uncultured Legionella sp. TaxID=210934 RepID=UPI00262FD9EA|nr:transposase [uncultured Legionella sp.]